MGWSGGKASIRIGKAQDCDVVLRYRGVSAVHAELRLLQAGGGGKLLVRDTSTNGTGMRRPGDTSTGLPSCLVRGSDFSVPEGAMLLVPMKLKADASSEKNSRAWLKVETEHLNEHEIEEAATAYAAQLEAKIAMQVAAPSSAADADATKGPRENAVEASAEDSDEAAIAAEVAGAKAAEAISTSGFGYGYGKLNLGLPTLHLAGAANSAAAAASATAATATTARPP